MQLTDRQQVLFDRLVILGEWATKDKLPQKVLEIRGFGSFFRGKPRPSDVDLLLRVQRPDRLPEFDEFVTLLKNIRSDRKLEKEFSNPRESLIKLRSDGDKRCTGVSDENYQKFLNWIEPYSWNMLHPQTIHGQCSFKAPEDYAKRMIKANLPNLNVIQFLNPNDTRLQPVDLRCGFVVSVWSREAPDIAQNLEALLSEDTVIDNLQKEMAYFGVQIPQVEALSRLYEAEIDLLNRTPRRRKEARSSWSWLEEFTKDHPNLRKFQHELEATEKAADRFNEEEWGSNLHTGPISLPQASKETDEARKKLKILYQKNDMLESLRNCLAEFKSGCAKTNLTAKEYVVDNLLSVGSKKQKEGMAEFLRLLEYPVNRVLQRNERELLQRR